MLHLQEQFEKLVPSMGKAVKAWLFDNQYLERQAQDRYVKNIKVAGVEWLLLVLFE